MTQEEISYFQTKLEKLQKGLVDLAGRYRMQSSGAYREVKSDVDEMKARVDKDAKPQESDDT